jgi:hypothetical protein
MSGICNGAQLKITLTIKRIQNVTLNNKKMIINDIKVDHGP